MVVRRVKTAIQRHRMRRQTRAAYAARKNRVVVPGGPTKLATTFEGRVGRGTRLRGAVNFGRIRASMANRTAKQRAAARRNAAIARRSR